MNIYATNFYTLWFLFFSVKIFKEDMFHLIYFVLNFYFLFIIDGVSTKSWSILRKRNSCNFFQKVLWKRRFPNSSWTWYKGKQNCMEGLSSIFVHSVLHIVSYDCFLDYKISHLKCYNDIYTEYLKWTLKIINFQLLFYSMKLLLWHTNISNCNKPIHFITN